MRAFFYLIVSAIFACSGIISIVHKEFGLAGVQFFVVGLSMERAFE